MASSQESESTRALFGLSTEGISEERLSELDIRFTGITPEALLNADLDNTDKEYVAVLQIGRILLTEYDPDKLSEWIRCRQQISGDYSYDNI